jgi:Fanconi anemia group M protein
MILVSPSEPQEFLSLIPDAVSSPVPERYGADFLISARGLTAGVQRKTLNDLISSLEDGRLAHEVRRLARLDVSVLAFENPYGFDNWSPLAMRYTPQQVLRLLFSIQAEGVWVFRTPSVAGTADLIRELAAWLAKGEHLSMRTRPKDVDRDGWGRATDRDWAVFLLQGFPGVGPVLAEAIYDRFGRVPLAWTCTEKELREIQGIGPKRARELIRCLA